MSYGITPAGFSRKPLAVILAEIEAQLITEFGPNVIQTSQSPLGQLNGLMADMIAEAWELAEDVYQSYDPNQAEGSRLDILGNLRLVKRGIGEDDTVYRQAITNIDTARITYADFIRALKSIPGVSFAQVFANDTGSNNSYGMPPNTVTAAVIGGDDLEIAKVINDFATPGVTLYGNTVINTDTEGYCRPVKFVRPLLIDTEIKVMVRLDPTARGCPAPAPSAIASALLEYLTDPETRPWNGQDITPFLVRQFIESRFPGTQFHSLSGVRLDRPDETAASINFIFFEMANVISVEAEGF